MKNKTDK